MAALVSVACADLLMVAVLHTAIREAQSMVLEDISADCVVKEMAESSATVSGMSTPVVRKKVLAEKVKPLSK